MSLRKRLFLTLCLIVVVGFFSIARWVRGELRNSYSQVVEELLVDYAHLFATQVEMSKMTLEGLASLDSLFQKYKSRNFQAPIFNFIKTSHSLEAYVTDLSGIVIFATQKENIGLNFSKWNDVYKTLKGQYGARSTRVKAEDSRTSIYYVAAPILIDGELKGVATVYKTESSILTFLDAALKKMFVGGFLSVLVLGLLGGLILIWITWPLEKLRLYALNVSEGQRVPPPSSNIKEIKDLGFAFEKMRISIEGKKTMEKYTQILTHELKSPLTAMKGAAELCLEEMDSEQRTRFLNNIIDEAQRSHAILEQLLKIAALESKGELDQIETLDPVEILNEVRDSLTGFWRNKKIEIKIIIKSQSSVKGDKFLLFQSFRNILQNALEFSPANTTIQIITADKNQYLQITFDDEGAGIPDYALPRIFEKFYSLERPDTKKKSSGLGLSFVKEVVELHKGQIQIQNSLTNERGTLVTLSLPIHHDTI